MELAGILPAAGSATRMRGIPKFMLPISARHSTLLDFHLEQISAVTDFVVVPTRPEWVDLVTSIASKYPDVHVLGIRTETMSETVLRSLATRRWSHAVVGLPDTFSPGKLNPYKALSESADQGLSDESLVWAGVTVYRSSPGQEGRLGSVKLDSNSNVVAHSDKNPERDFGSHWGQICFSHSAIGLLDPKTPHVGAIIDVLLDQRRPISATKINQRYFDCGTFNEYLEALNAADQSLQENSLKR